ncbi:MAG: GspE/PulE family protein, partial [Tissierellia bacterium]|nr:GspE/PulE family protein [Tissierellia bacterium]
IVSRIKILSKLNIAVKRLPQDGRITFKYQNRDIDMRISTIPTIRGEKIVIRIFDSHFKINNIEDLGITKSEHNLLENLLKNPNGLILLCGPTGCGKSTTIYTILQELNEEEINITTIEDPVEYKISGINQIQIRPSIGLDFDTALAHILRQDPEIIFVGELRTEITARTAMRAALTGHRVFSTIHTYSALSAVDRLKDMNIEPYLISAGVNGIISQRLVKKLCPNCRMKINEANDYFDAKYYYQAVGCDKCNEGYIGRTAIFEILVLNKELKRAIIKNESYDELLKIAKRDGFLEMRDKFSKVLEEGITTFEELMKVLNSLE